MDQLAAGLGDLNREARVAGRNQSQAWLQASNPAPAGGTWLSAQRGKPEGGGPIPSWPRSPPSTKADRLLRPSPNPSGPRAWASGFLPGTKRTGLGGSIGAGPGVDHPAATGQGQPVAASHGPILAIPRDTLGDRSRARKPASIDQEAHAQGLASTTANQPEPAQRWQPRAAEALGKPLIGEAMGRPA